MFDSKINEGSIAAKIVSVPTTTLCIVQDTKERQFAVESNGSYRIGEIVLIKNDVIIGKTKTLRNIKHFNI